ncbi:MAG: Phosphoribosylanthranilate isomerase [Cyanobacteria bacterium RYN_339]|nr:Phosphoribosylanthranilate isomerase [Cyanobacteria bacterium RYN_339]
MRTRAKICGLTRAEDVALAAQLGADAVGFVFAAGPRQVTPQLARDLAAAVPAWVNRVGVFGPDQKQEAPAIAEACRLDTIQLHGEPDAAFCAYFRGRFAVVQAISVGDAAVDKLQATLDELAPHVDALLLDTAKAGMLGGTGETFDWRLLNILKAAKPVIIAGGLKPGNVSQLLAAYRPWGVDVSSGVESAPGVKDVEKVRAFLAALT